LEDYSAFCRRILSLDESIRFVGVANEIGSIVSSAYRKDLQPLLTKEESELSVTQSVIRMGTRKTMEEKLGKTIYAFALYEKVKRATIPLHDGSILMVSFDVESSHEKIILDGIMPIVAALMNKGTLNKNE
jgi:hypothetical protein